MILNKNELKKIQYDYNSNTNRLLQADFSEYTSILKKYIHFFKKHGHHLFIYFCLWKTRLWSGKWDKRSTIIIWQKNFRYWWNWWRRSEKCLLCISAYRWSWYWYFIWGNAFIRSWFKALSRWNKKF